MEELELENAKVYHYSNFISDEESVDILEIMSELFEQELNKDILDENDKPKYKLNRKTLVFVDPLINNKIIPKIWGHDVTILEFPESLVHIKNKLEELLADKYKFNICLANYYVNGKKGIGWHSDNEEKGNTNCIASISLGAERMFHFRKVDCKEIYKSIMLNHGSLLLMSEGCQENYQHSLPVDKSCTTPRLNLTFRIFDNNKYSSF